MKKQNYSILEKIINEKKIEVNRAKELSPLLDLKEKTCSLPPTRSFKSSINRKNSVSIVAEIKKHSPSKGLLRTDFNVKKIAQIYTKTGAAAISVLTDRNFFHGQPGYISLVKKTTHLPVLYKEFIIDPYQIYLARILGADAILLIAATLTKDKIIQFLHLAEKLGLEVLLETSNEKEIQLALDLGVKIIGINNRDLKSFKTDLEKTFNLRSIIKDPSIIVVSESGISCREDIEKLAKHEVHAALIGESLMRADNIEAKLKELMGYCSSNGGETNILPA